MPDGKTHIKINKVVFVLIAVLVYLMNYIVPMKWFLFGFIFGMYYLTPDLDTDGTDPDKNWGMFQFMWNGYSKIFVHRGISHSVFFGTLTRLVTLSIIILIGYVGFMLFIKGTNNLYTDLISLYYFVINNACQIGLFSLGIFSADMSHIIADKIYSAKKRKLRKVFYKRKQFKIRYIFITGIIILILWGLQ